MINTLKWWLWMFVALAIGFGIGGIVYKLTWIEGGVDFFWIVIAGGFGGIIHGLVNDGGSGKFRLPRGTTPTESEVVADIGIFGEMLIGMLGAMVSILVIALFLGSDPFADKESDISVFRLIGFGALAGFAARQFLPNLSKRFSALIEQKIETMAAAAEREQARQAALTAEEQKSRNEIGRLAAEPRPDPAVLRAQAAPNLDPLESQVQTFAGITYDTHPDYQTRVRAMMDLADQMVEGIPASPATKDSILQRVQSADDKVWLVPLATLIAKSPEDGDAKLLLDAYDLALNDPAVRKKSKFILYRILLAIIALSDSVRLPTDQQPRVQAIAEACLAIDEPSLKRRAEVVLEMLN